MATAVEQKTEQKKKKRPKNSSKVYVEEWNKGNKDIQSIAKQFGVGVQTVYTGLRVNGIQPTTPRASFNATKETVLKALEKYNGNINKAADSLDVSHQTLRQKIKEYKFKKKVTWEE